MNICVKNSKKDFSRKRKLPLETILLMLVGMGTGISGIYKFLCTGFKVPGYRLLAVDVSDLRLPSNPDVFSAVKNAENGGNYNLVHLNVMFDILNKIYNNRFFNFSIA